MDNKANDRKEDKTWKEDKNLRLGLLILAGLLGLFIFVLLEKRSENIWCVSLFYITFSISIFFTFLVKIKWKYIIFLIPFIFFISSIFFIPSICEWFQCISFFKDLEITELKEGVLIILIGLPVFTFLWFFRTHDIREQIDKTREQIKKSQEQIDQTELFKALSDLATNNPLAIKTAVSKLILINKKNKSYYIEIRLAFIGRLKQKVSDNEYFRIKDNLNLKLDYAQYILKWLARNLNDKDNLDLRGCCFDDQEFVIKEFKGGKDGKQENPFTTFFKKKCLDGEIYQNPFNLSFIKTDLREIDLREIDLRGAKLQKVDLREADLRGAFLDKPVFENYKQAIESIPTVYPIMEIKKIKKDLIKDHFKQEEANDLRGARFYQKDLEKHGLDIEEYEKLGLVIEEDPKPKD